MRSLNATTTRVGHYSPEKSYGWLRPVLRLGLKVFVGKTEAMLGWEREKNKLQK